MFFPKSIRKIFRPDAPAETLIFAFSQLASSVNPFEEFRCDETDFEEDAKEALGVCFDFMTGYISGEAPNLETGVEMEKFVAALLVFQRTLVDEQKLARFLDAGAVFAEGLENEDKTVFEE